VWINGDWIGEIGDSVFFSEDDNEYTVPGFTQVGQLFEQKIESWRGWVSFLSKSGVNSRER